MAKEFTSITVENKNLARLTELANSLVGSVMIELSPNQQLGIVLTELEKLNVEPEEKL